MGMPQTKLKRISMPHRFFRQTSTFLMDFSRAGRGERSAASRNRTPM
jgi:hypothetical protein